jgi:hypothetical protein
MADSSDTEPLPPGVKITKASRTLQEKAGTGEIDPKLVERAEQFILDNKEDFLPLALELMALLAHRLEEVNRKKPRLRGDLLKLQEPIMQIKANGRMFHFALASQLAAIVLDFLEHVEKPDDDVLAIVQAHLSGLQLVMSKKIRDDRDTNGALLLKEIEEACKRYHKKAKTGK